MSNPDTTIQEVKEKTRIQQLEDIAGQLSLAEAAYLMGRVHEKKSVVSKSKRFGLFPITDWNAYRRCKVLESLSWPADEIKFTADIEDFRSLDPHVQKPLIHAFGFFAVGDGSIVSMLAYRLILAATTFESQQYFVIQLANERVHGEVYGRMIFTLIADEAERNRILESVENVKSIGKMNAVIEQGFISDDGDRSIYISLAATEYIMFTPLFCIIFWYQTYYPGKLKNIIKANRQIMKDETEHCMNGLANYLSLPPAQRYDDAQIHEVIARYVEAVDEFVDETFEDVFLQDLTSQNVKQYVRYVADDLLIRAKHSRAYNVQNPFPWMELTNLRPITNFYEDTELEYSRLNVEAVYAEAQKLCNVTPKIGTPVAVKTARANRW